MEFNLSKVEMSKNDIRVGIKLPKYLTKELAEFIGIMVGDGHLGFYLANKTNAPRRCPNYEIRISGNVKEIKYLEYVRNLFYSLFNIEMYLNKDTNPGALVLRKHSRGIVQFLNRICELPLNNKSNISRIPSIIKKADAQFKYAFLRGLADTDFSVTFKNRIKRGHTYPVIKASFKSKSLVLDLEDLFKEIGFRYSVCYDCVQKDKRFATVTMHSIYLNGKENLRRWVDCINFSNYKFQHKVEKWRLDGACPPGY